MMFASIRAFVLKKVTVSLLVAVVAILCISVLVLFSASQGSWDKLYSHLVNISIAIFLMWCIANLPFQYLHRIAFSLYVVGVLLLVLTMLIGDTSKGAQRWLDFGFIRLQPSELMKIAVPLTLAWYFDRYEKVLSLSNFIVATILLLIPVALILDQPDLYCHTCRGIWVFHHIFCGTIYESSCISHYSESSRLAVCLGVFT